MILSDLIVGGHWGEVKNRKKFFDDFASDRNFDPLISENWYSITTKDVEGTKVCFD